MQGTFAFSAAVILLTLWASAVRGVFGGVAFFGGGGGRFGLPFGGAGIPGIWGALALPPGSVFSLLGFSFLLFLSFFCFSTSVFATNGAPATLFSPQPPGLALNSLSKSFRFRFCCSRSRTRSTCFHNHSHVFFFDPCLASRLFVIFDVSDVHRSSSSMRWLYRV